jgi:excisionase family DNA binding protein
MRGTLPVLLTVDEAAELLRTTRRAIYAMIERRQLPGVIRVRRRVLVRADDLLDWLDQKRALSPLEGAIRLLGCSGVHRNRGSILEAVEGDSAISNE